MKKTLIAVAALAATGAFAQNVTVYGVMDGGFADSGSGAQFVNGGVNGTSRLGVKGSEDLGGGLKSVYQIETGVKSGAEGANGTDGTNATRLGDRGAFVGLAGGFGTVTIGSSQLTPSFFARAATDTSTVNNYSIAKFAGSTRLDNSISYTSNNLSGLTLRAAYVLSADNSGNAASDVSAVYANGPLTVAASSANSGTATGTFFGASYDFGMAKVLVNTVKDTDTHNSIGVSAPMGAWTLQADYRADVDANVKTYVVSGQYALSKSTSLTVFTSKADTASNNTTGFGIRKNF